jgi:predicted PurR-regulated permease PerM
MKTLLRRLYGVLVLVRMLGPLVLLSLLVIMGLYGYQEFSNTLSRPLAALQQEMGALKKGFDAVNEDINSVTKVSKDAAEGLSKVTGTVTGSVGGVVNIFDPNAGKKVAASGKQLGQELTREVSKLKTAFTGLFPNIGNAAKIVAALQQFFSDWLFPLLVIFLLTALFFISAYLEFLYLNFRRIPEAWKMVVAKHVDPSSVG